MLESFGSLRIRASAASSALPVPGALVRISGAEESNRLVNYTLITDRDGLTEKVRLPAPAVKYSLEPDPEERPYSIYDVEIIASGYFTKRILALTVFSGVDSIQIINMIPESGAPTVDYPRGNVNTVIPENDLN
jgi:hypothetical protein